MKKILAAIALFSISLSSFASYDFDVMLESANDLAQSTSYQQLTLDADLGADNDQCLTGYLHLFEPSSTTFTKHFII